MVRNSFIFISIFLFNTTVVVFGQETITSEFVLNKLLKSTSSYKSLRYKLEINERKDGKISKQISTSSLTLRPFKVYIHQEYPKKGLEVLYVEGWNDNKAYINPNGFPWINISFDPRSQTLRENTHHTILESGFSYFNSIVSNLRIKYYQKIDELITLEGEEIINGKICFKLILKNRNFKIIDYRGKPSETIETYAKHHFISDHMILELNPDFTDYSASIEGKTIKTPNDYASKMIVYVDKQTFFPILAQIYDQKGLYEEYNYLLLEINPTFKENEFNPSFSEYGF